MLQLKEKKFEPIKRYFDSQILSGTCNGVYTCVVEIPEQIKFADYAFIAPSHDLNGKRVKHTKRGIMHRISVTIFPEQTKSWLLTSCLDSERKIYEAFLSRCRRPLYRK